MKTGRKQQDHRNSKDGKPVVGLSKMTDGRWRIIGTQIRFSEPDEQKAIARFHNIKEKNGFPHDYPQDLIDFPMNFVGSPVFAIQHGFYLTTAPDAEEKMWRWIGSEIRKAPELRARMTGIEEIGYFQNVKPLELDGPVEMPLI